MALQRRMRSIPSSRITLTDPFWSRWQRTLVETTLPAEFRQLESTARLTNFRRAAGLEAGGHEGLYFNDSDVFKWAEACAYALGATAHHAHLAKSRKDLRASLDLVIGLIERAQEPSGYLNTYFQLARPRDKWRNLSAMHEMYSAGHLFEAGVAAFESLHDRRLLDVSVRFADHIMSIFGPGRRRGYCGHQEIELALVRLAHATGERKYRDFARWMVEERGKSPSVFAIEAEDAEVMAISPWMSSLLVRDGKYHGEYAQDHEPIRQHTEIVGHAVRAMYFYIAATDLADGAGDTDLENALERIWKNLVTKRMYVTGGIGPSSSNEGFTGDYDLPNLTAYAETCAACGLVFWGHTLLEMTGNAEYADIYERALYNGALSGISLSGDAFFYDNPLESRGQHQRVPWFTCACCPPNIARLVGNVSHYAAGESDRAFWIHLPVGFAARTMFAGQSTEISVDSNYPWSGKTTVKVNPDRAVPFDLRIRIPEWAHEVSLDFPANDREAEYEDGYIVLRRTWNPGDEFTLEFEMNARWIEADPRVRDNLGRSALTRGPLVFCAEESDLSYAPQLFTADTSVEVQTRHEDGLGGIEVMTARGSRETEEFADTLYAELGTASVVDAEATFIPYFAWNNRGAQNMQVWVRAR